jgi:hypothetical protein
LKNKKAMGNAKTRKAMSYTKAKKATWATWRWRSHEIHGDQELRSCEVWTLGRLCEEHED